MVQQGLPSAISSKIPAKKSR